MRPAAGLRRSGRRGGRVPAGAGIPALPGVLGGTRSGLRARGGVSGRRGGQRSRRASSPRHSLGKGGHRRGAAPTPRQRIQVPLSDAKKNPRRTGGRRHAAVPSALRTTKADESATKPKRGILDPKKDDAQLSPGPAIDLIGPIAQDNATARIWSPAMLDQVRARELPFVWKQTA